MNSGDVADLDNEGMIPRAAVLTPRDLSNLGDLLEKKIKEGHKCRYEIEPKDMALVADLVQIYKETRSVFLKALVGVFLSACLIVGILAVKAGLVGK